MNRENMRKQDTTFSNQFYSSFLFFLYFPSDWLFSHNISNFNPSCDSVHVEGGAPYRPEAAGACSRDAAAQLEAERRGKAVI